MTTDLNTHPCFTRWTDPQSGVESFLLTERVAPVQQTFYFTNPGISRDERWCWFYTAFPPNPQHTLGVVSLDPARPLLRHFPQAGFRTESPLVAPEGDAVYFACGESVVWMNVEGETRTVCTLPADYIAGRRLTRLVTHLTMSADGKYFLLDGAIANHWFVALAEVATGEVRVLHEFGRNYNHGQFSPTDPKLFSIAQDHWKDAISGRQFWFDHRIWVMDTEGTRFEPVRPTEWVAHNAYPCHEWWSPDGLMCWTDYDRGVFEIDVNTHEMTHVWKRPLCHTHCDAARRLFVADESPYKWGQKPCEVILFDRQSGTETHIASALPPPRVPRGAYHIDPHPQFSPQGTWIDYTTTVRGTVDVAICPVGQVRG